MASTRCQPPGSSFPSRPPEVLAHGSTTSSSVSSSSTPGRRTQPRSLTSPSSTGSTTPSPSSPLSSRSLPEETLSSSTSSTSRPKCRSVCTGKSTSSPRSSTVTALTSSDSRLKAPDGINLVASKSPSPRSSSPSYPSSTASPCLSLKARKRRASTSAPVYMNESRGKTYVTTAQLKTKHPPLRWVLAGVAMILDVEGVSDAFPFGKEPAQ